MIYTDQEKKQIYNLKKEIIDKCSLCKGIGYIKEKKCDCHILFDFVKLLYISKMKRKYWFMNLDQLKLETHIKIYINKYLSNLDNALNNCQGFIFLGTNGVGKTSLMKIIGKQAIINQYKVFYISLKTILNNIFKEDELIIERLKESNLILLDELDKVYWKNTDWIVSNLDEFLRTYLGDKSIIISSNFTESGKEDSIEENFGPSIYSLLKEYNKFLVIEGEDYRKKLDKEWLNRLTKENIDYNKLLSYAKEWNKNKLKIEKNEYDLVIE